MVNWLEVWTRGKEIMVLLRAEGEDWDEAVKIEVLKAGGCHKSVVQMITQWPDRLEVAGEQICLVLPDEFRGEE